MPRIVFISHQGVAREVQARAGISVMQAALDAGVPGILGDCGGACSCATCHGYVEPEWLARVGEPTPLESDMLPATVDPRDNSRLCCQIILCEELDGLTVRLPESQV